MKKFLLVREQHGTGCDYTIGCGTTAEIITAPTLEAATLRALDLPDDIEKLLEDAFVEAKEEGNVDFDEELDLGLPSIYNGGQAWECDLDSITLYEISDTVELAPIVLDIKSRISKVKAEIKNTSQEIAERKKYEELKKKFGK